LPWITRTLQAEDVRIEAGRMLSRKEREYVRVQLEMGADVSEIVAGLECRVREPDHTIRSLVDTRAKEGLTENVHEHTSPVRIAHPVLGPAPAAARVRDSGRTTTRRG